MHLCFLAFCDIICVTIYFLKTCYFTSCVQSSLENNYFKEVCTLKTDYTKKKTSSKKNYLKFFRPELPKILLSGILCLIIMAKGFLDPQLASKMLVGLNSLGSELASGNSGTEQFYYNCNIAILLLGINLIALVSKFFYEKLIIRIKGNVSKNIKYSMARNLMDSTSKSVMELDTEALASRMSEGKSFVDVVHNLTDHFWNIAIGLVVLIYTLLISPHIFALYAIFLVLLFITRQKMRKNMIEASNKLKESQDATRSLLKEAIDAFLDVKTQLLGIGLKKHFLSLNNNESDSIVTEGDTIAKSSAILTLMSDLFQVSFLILGFYLVYTHRLAFESVITLFMYRNYIISMVSSLSRATIDSARVDSCIQRMDDILQFKKLEYDEFGEVSLKMNNIQGMIEVRNVSLSIEGRQILNNVSTEINSGTIVGIAGASGCGKSTLLKILAHEIKPDSGEVLLDNVNIKDVAPYTLRRFIKLAPQAPKLFSMSFRDNLLLANLEATDEEIWECLEAANAAEFVREKGGLDVIVDLNKLSGGQTQRIALARLLLNKSRILLLDEATSALDNFSQAEVLKTVEKLAESHTVIIVAHRLSTIKNADKIIFMDNGEILDTGTFEELLEKNEKFKKMANL